VSRERAYSIIVVYGPLVSGPTRPWGMTHGSLYAHALYGYEYNMTQTLCLRNVSADDRGGGGSRPLFSTLCLILATNFPQTSMVSRCPYHQETCPTDKVEPSTDFCCRNSTSARCTKHGKHASRFPILFLRWAPPLLRRHWHRCKRRCKHRCRRLAGEPTAFK
jgi:hypothetical protein